MELKCVRQEAPIGDSSACRRLTLLRTQKDTFTCSQYPSIFLLEAGRSSCPHSLGSVIRLRSALSQERTAVDTTRMASSYRRRACNTGNP
eukprot:3282967-Amphidinium_carterae.1